MEFITVSLAALHVLSRQESITTLHSTETDDLGLGKTTHSIQTYLLLRTISNKWTEKQAGHCKGVHSMTTATWSCIVEPSICGSSSSSSSKLQHCGKHSGNAGKQGCTTCFYLRCSRTWVLLWRRRGAKVRHPRPEFLWKCNNRFLKERQERQVVGHCSVG